MEQKAKQAWNVDNPYEPNPYASLPAINIYTYDLGTLMSEYVFLPGLRTLRREPLLTRELTREQRERTSLKSLLRRQSVRVLIL